MIDNLQFHDLFLQQPQGPARASLGRFGTSQRNQFGFLLAVKNPRNRRCRPLFATQHSLEAFFHQLLADPVNHRCAGLQRLDIRLSLQPSPASDTSAFNNIRAFSSRWAALLPFRISASRCSRSSPLSRTTYFFTEISLAAMILSVAGFATESNHKIHIPA